ncbi:hypothetical protein M0R19_04445 [Candidatus Pacearchaeota archaeon]|jgi:nucleoside-diphosphate-sugar epimerase|nr:hypothetical protein [Candidatus Pacearchaeota archaeon]
MKIAVIGSNGFIGSELFLLLKKGSFDVYGITRKNYKQMIQEDYEVVIDCAGNSKKYLSLNDHVYDYEKNVIELEQRITEIKFDKYILISSIDSIYKLNIFYGLHKKIGENILLNYCEQNNKICTIIRCASVLGNDMKKGLIYDIINDKKVYLTEDSYLRFVRIDDLFNIIHREVNKNGFSKKSLTYNLCSNSVSIDYIRRFFNKNINFNSDLRKSSYEKELYDCQFKDSDIDIILNAEEIFKAMEKKI